MSAKYALFSRIYVATGDHIRAYRESGFSATTEASLRSCALRVLRIPAVKDYIKELQDAAKERLAFEMSKEFMKTRKVRQDIAYSDVGDIFDFDKPGLPKHKDSKDIPKRALKAIGSVKVTIDKDNDTKTVEYKLRDPDKHLSAIEEKYAVMPDNERPAQKIDVTVQGAVRDMELAKAGIMAVVQAIKARQVNVLPAANEPGS